MDTAAEKSPPEKPQHQSEIEEQYLGGEFSSDIMKQMRKDPTAIGKLFKEGKYPYTDKIARRAYEAEKKKLQIELLKVQNWVKLTGQKIVIIFEGRDAAGKGGTIKRFMEHLNPRAAKVIALEKPTPHEQGQWYFQRYIEHLPTRGEILFLDRSWYNRAGVERVMGFCDQVEYLEFMRQCPEVERMLANSGINMFKYYFSVTKKEQRGRFDARLHESPFCMSDLDGDDDSHPVGSDCDDTDGDVWELPGEVPLLTFSDKDTLDWLPPAMLGGR